jgi:hypothetical protein
MAENKKGFVLYADQIDLIKELTDEEAGILIKHIFLYVNDKNPTLENRLVKIAFEPIKTQLKRDLIKYESVREKRSIAGKASADSKKQNSTNSTLVESVKQNSTNSTVIVKDNVIVKVKDKVKDIKLLEQKNISLTHIEYEKLVNEFSETLTLAAIKFLSDYKIEKGYKTKNDNLTIRRWVIDAVKKNNVPVNQTQASKFDKIVETVNKAHEQIRKRHEANNG